MIWQCALVILLTVKYSFSASISNDGENSEPNRKSNCREDPYTVRTKERMNNVPYPTSGPLEFFIATRDFTTVELFIAESYTTPCFSIVFGQSFGVMIHRNSTRLETNPKHLTFNRNFVRSFETFYIDCDTESRTLVVGQSTTKFDRKVTYSEANNTDWTCVFKKFNFLTNSYGARILNLKPSPSLNALVPQVKALWCPFINDQPPPGSFRPLIVRARVIEDQAEALIADGAFELRKVVADSALPITTFMYAGDYGRPKVPCFGDDVDSNPVSDGYVSERMECDGFPTEKSDLYNLGVYVRVHGDYKVLIQP